MTEQRAETEAICQISFEIRDENGDWSGDWLRMGL